MGLTHRAQLDIDAILLPGLLGLTIMYDMPTLEELCCEQLADKITYVRFYMTYVLISSENNCLSVLQLVDSSVMDARSKNTKINAIYSKIRAESIECSAKHLIQIQDNENFIMLTLAQVHEIYLKLENTIDRYQLLVCCGNFYFSQCIYRKKSTCSHYGNM